ncbi:hypothetical protein [Dendronalium sp. ChiSLP03b]|uniref:hypothetical protein n=1 Tax=Dendronalium sp. ChiSLP03b TaxID=3075381 RepID=UPI002AD45255|nr:hypothetical protein [Dendronalium sp. ChiSLP03b]MDZ8204917.1 hypothetical protein [Dendronalium sp. ChiSLP03b]
MSSGSSGRYQSRLFNFVHQQSRRLTEKWEHTFRHLQVASKWSVEVLLARVYQLFQSVESAGKTLSAKESQSRLKLQPNDNEFQPETPPNPDIAIQRVLESVQNLPSTVTSLKTLELGIGKKDVSFSSQSPLPLISREDSKFPIVPNPQRGFRVLQSPITLVSWWQKFFHPTTNPSLSQSLTITDNLAGSLNSSKAEDALKHNPLVVQGIATNLENRKLVLVCANNEILDILTPQQQSKLEDRIISEVANYWHYWRLAEAKQTNLLPEINQLLIKLTGGNTDNTPALAEGTPKDLLNTDRMLAFIDTFVAKLEANAIIPVQQRSQEIVKVAQTQLNIFIYGKEQLADRGNITVTADDLEPHTLDFQALLEAALNYFFGVSKGKKLETSDPHGQSQAKLLAYRRSVFLPKSNQLQNDDLAVDPWLNWDDLFGNGTVANKLVIPSSSINPPLAPGLSTPIFPPKKLIQRPKSESGLVQNQKSVRDRTSTQRTSGKITSARQTTASISRSRSESHNGEISQQHRLGTEVEAKPDWIETKAISMGYEKHPLELLLEWLDRAMLWLEKIFVNIFYFFQGLLGGKKASRH